MTYNKSPDNENTDDVDGMTGSRKSLTKGSDNDDDDGSEHDFDPSVDRWWGFWDPVKIRTLAEWLRISHERDLSQPTSRPSTKSSKTSSSVPAEGPTVDTASIQDLSDKIVHYADMLAWRMESRISEHELKGEVNADTHAKGAAGKSKPKTVAVQSFYK